MSQTRNNHYVPQWFQEGFFVPGETELAYLDLNPARTILKDGQVKLHNSRFVRPTEKCFRERDLYSTFFGRSVNDEIERILFGRIDSKGARAVRAFIGTDVGEWVRHFETFFTYIDAQKIRTPKGLNWLRAQYPALEQNELMMEMQGIRNMHCSIWSGGVREIVSAENSEVKFIVSDHPVTIYNHALPPGHEVYRGGNEPSIALKGSQTIFPLCSDFCLILTNLEYARDPAAPPLEKRTFARNFSTSFVKADSMIRERKLSASEVAQINFILKKQARRFIAGGKEEWLHPEAAVSGSWSDLRTTLSPPADSLWGFGGEIYARTEDGNVHYQDEFGRRGKQWERLLKSTDEKTLKPTDACGCGSGKRYRDCCKSRPEKFRPSWKERSIRERNLMLYSAIVEELGLDSGKSWVEIRTALTDEQIAKIHALYAVLWPVETNLLDLLPKPDGTQRAVYTGALHPNAISEFALGAPLYFGELLIENPFIHAGSVQKEFSPVESPRGYRQEFLKSVIFFLTVMPLVDDGLVNLIPDPCIFDLHLRDQMRHMAEERMRGVFVDPKKDPRMRELMEEDAKRSLLALSPEALRNQMLRAEPEATELQVQQFLKEWST